MTRQINRPVFIFYGNSCMCKSHIASTTNKEVFETDMHDMLPETITEEIIVFGNRKKNYTIEDVEEKIYNKDCCKIIKVHFHD